MPTFKVEYIQTIETNSHKSKYSNPAPLYTYHHFRINGIDCSIEISHESAIDEGKQLGLEMERVFNLVIAAQETHRLEKCVAYINEEARH